ncbi:MAG: hypothetical protein GY791_16160 [Alphaproteobacteria bacterium]|nr:hypothetical protein [Alphaproteobacteria bacterium]
MADFWRSSGYHLLNKDKTGRLAVTPEFLRAYIGRPELAPVEESCPAELRLHEDLMADPTMAVEARRIEEFADPDARDNYHAVLRFRDVLLREGTLESGYIALFRNGVSGFPPLFLDQLVHAIMRGVLDRCPDPLRVRAGELLFRSQKVTIKEDTIMVADEEIVDMRATRDARDGIVHFDHIGQLLTDSQPSGRVIELDVLDEETGAVYWRRSDSFDTVLDIGFTKPGLDAFCRALEAWVRHLLAIEVTIYPVQSISDERWVWHVGLDSEATAMLNDLYNGVPLNDDRRYRLLCLFRAEFPDPDAMLPNVKGRPVYMAMAMTTDGVLRIKPQNLIFNLPLATAA